MMIIIIKNQRVVSSNRGLGFLSSIHMCHKLLKQNARAMRDYYYYYYCCCAC